MLESFLITSRETLEASLVVGIVLAYLQKTDNARYRMSVYAGVVAGILASILVAVLFHVVAGGFEGRAEALFEGTTMLIGAALLTTMILWMAKQRHIAKELEAKVGQKINEQHPFMSSVGIFLLVFVAIIREGVETVIFLNAIHYASDVSLIAGFMGVGVAIVLGWLCFKSFLKMHLKHIFTASSVVLILFAAGLVAHGVHEYQEAGVLPTYVNPLFDINPEVNADGTFPALHESGVVGSFLKGLFGYNGNPTLIEVAVYVLYLIGAFTFFFSGKILKRRSALSHK